MNDVTIEKVKEMAHDEYMNALNTKINRLGGLITTQRAENNEPKITREQLQELTDEQRMQVKDLLKIDELEFLTVAQLKTIVLKKNIFIPNSIVNNDVELCGLLWHIVKEVL